MTHADAILGSPPRSWSTLKADLTRLRRSYSYDDETAQARSVTSNLLDDARINLLDSLLEHIEPAVRDEAAGWDDRELQRAKDGWTYSLDQPR